MRGLCLCTRVGLIGSAHTTRQTFSVTFNFCGSWRSSNVGSERMVKYTFDLFFSCFFCIIIGGSISTVAQHSQPAALQLPVPTLSRQADVLWACEETCWVYTYVPQQVKEVLPDAVKQVVTIGCGCVLYACVCVCRCVGDCVLCVSVGVGGCKLEIVKHPCSSVHGCICSAGFKFH